MLASTLRESGVEAAVARYHAYKTLPEHENIDTEVPMNNLGCDVSMVG